MLCFWAIIFLPETTPWFSCYKTNYRLKYVSLYLLNNFVLILFFQRSTVDRLTNTLVLMLFLMLVVLCFISAIFNEIWTREHFKKDWYLGIDGKSRKKTMYLNQYQINAPIFISDVLSKNFGYNLLTFIILYNNLIPISLQVTLELVRFLQVSSSLKSILY